MLGSRALPRAAQDANRRRGAANGRPVEANVAAWGAWDQSRSAGACAGSAPPVMGGTGAGWTVGRSPSFFSRTR
jgi:hypothetical protein